MSSKSSHFKNKEEAQLLFEKKRRQEGKLTKTVRVSAEMVRRGNEDRFEREAEIYVAEERGKSHQVEDATLQDPTVQTVTAGMKARAKIWRDQLGPDVGGERDWSRSVGGVVEEARTLDGPCFSEFMLRE